MVFTDGASNDNSATVQEARHLHRIADKTYGFGIGSGIQENELRQIASKPEYYAKMTNFAELQDFARKFFGPQKGCATTKRQGWDKIKECDYVIFGR